MLSEFLQSTGNQILRLDPDGLKKFARLNGKVFKLEISVIQKSLFFIPNESGMEITESWEGDIDITLRGSPLAFAQFGLKQRGIDNQLFQDKRLIIEGDVELAQEFEKLLKEFDIDFEEILSRYIGDVAAHQIGRGARAFRDWLEEAGESLNTNMREYLVEEYRILAPGWRVSGFIQTVDTLRSDVERLEQRVQRLKDQS